MAENRNKITKAINAYNCYVIVIDSISLKTRPETFLFYLLLNLQIILQNEIVNSGRKFIDLAERQRGHDPKLFPGFKILVYKQWHEKKKLFQGKQSH